MRYRSKSIAAVVIANLMIVTTLLLGFCGILNYTSEKSRRELRLRQEVAETADEVAIALSLPVSKAEYDQVEQITVSVLHRVRSEGSW